MTGPLWSRFEEAIGSGLKNAFEQLNSLQEHINSTRSPAPNGNEGAEGCALIHYWLEIELFVKHCNGGIGYDTFVAKRTLYPLLGYVWILENAAVGKKDQDRCATEIQVYFYTLINCIYNVKAKWHKFVNFDKNKRKCIVSSVLNAEGRRALSDRVDSLYRGIESLCSARRSLVHDICTVSFDPKNRLLRVGPSRFTLAEKNLWNTGKNVARSLSRDDVLRSVEELEKHRRDILSILSNHDFIDIDKLKDKYTDHDGKRMKFGLA